MTEPTPRNVLLATMLQDGVLKPQLGVGKANSLLEFMPNKPEPPAMLSFEELFHEVIDAPMYRTVLLHVDAVPQVARLCRTEYEYDRFCPTCGKETPWQTYVSASMASKSAAWAGVRQLQNYCKRCKLWESIWLEFNPADDMDPNGGVSTLTKIGQNPSVAAFHGNDMARFMPVTTERQRADFTKAVEGAAHGFAAGAVTYLRRVLESILNDARDAHMKDAGLADWPEYKAAKTNKKMELLKDRLPPFLTENKRLYNLLSQGIHSLPDEECQELYPMLRQAIELLFDEKLDQLEKEKHRAKVALFIAQNDNPKN